MDLYAPTISERQATVLYALAQEQFARTNMERPTEDEDQQNQDASSVALAVYLARRPYLAQLVAMLNAANGLEDAVISEAMALGTAGDELAAWNHFLRDLSNLLHARLGDLMCDRWSADMKATAQEAAA